MPKTRLRQECVSNGGHEKIKRWADARRRGVGGLNKAEAERRHNEIVRRRSASAFAHVGPLMQAMEVAP